MIWRSPNAHHSQCCHSNLSSKHLLTTKQIKIISDKQISYWQGSMVNSHPYQWVLDFMDFGFGTLRCSESKGEKLVWIQNMSKSTDYFWNDKRFNIFVYLLWNNIYEILTYLKHHIIRNWAFLLFISRDRPIWGCCRSKSCRRYVTFFCIVEDKQLNVSESHGAKSESKMQNFHQR